MSDTEVCFSLETLIEAMENIRKNYKYDPLANVVFCPKCLEPLHDIHCANCFWNLPNE